MWFPSLLLVLASIFFVAAEYAVVSVRRSRIEALARRGNKAAKRVARDLDNVSSFVAAGQIGITMIGIGVGSVTEPYVTGLLTSMISRNATLAALLGDRATATVGYTLSFILVAFVLVVVGELCPKYFALRRPEQVALVTFGPMRLVASILKPISSVAQGTANLILRLFRVDTTNTQGDSIPKEELLMLIQTGGTEGVLERAHADLVSRALRLDVLHARDIMIHRLDIKWLDLSLDMPTLLSKLKNIPYNRIPVGRGDIDDLAGLIYIHDVVRNLGEEDFTMEKIVRPMVAVPENLSLERIVETMRSEKTQMLIVMDEYGGTSGLVTLEDVVEEVFGELEDRLESERPQIEDMGHGRYSARAEVRIDELVSRLKLHLDAGENTDTLAQIIVDELGRVPRPGDSIETDLGLMRVENMARRRVTRVTIQVKPDLFKPPADD